MSQLREEKAGEVNYATTSDVALAVFLLVRPLIRLHWPVTVTPGTAHRWRHVQCPLPWRSSFCCGHRHRCSPRAG
jgi:hypothetical protein